MTCREAEHLLRDYADHELEEAQVAPLEAHLSGCDACRARLGTERDLKLVIRARGRPGPAPAGLAAAISREVRAEAGSSTIRPQLRRRRFVLAGVAAGLLVAAAATAVWTALSPEPRSGPRLTVELVNDHIRYLTARDTAQVATADPREAETWFSSRLDFALSLPRFDAEDVRLTGGRQCYVLDRRVALLFYTRGAQQLSLFVMDASGLDFHGMSPVGKAHAECATESYKGFKVVGWKQRGLLFALVADEGQDGLVDLVARTYAGSNPKDEGPR